jgi:hypothetical protein
MKFAEYAPTRVVQEKLLFAMIEFREKDTRENFMQLYWAIYVACRDGSGLIGKQLPDVVDEVYGAETPNVTINQS